ncbi:7352_t:CDS:2 [Entrophospora sp. SA101]|nr:7352_t:CDS:2 [Entrophospora sp. SA101]
MAQVEFFEWIEWSELDLIEYEDTGLYSTIYSAYWIDGPILLWEKTMDCYIRNGPIKVAIKRFNNSQNISEEFINRVLCWRDIVEILWSISNGLDHIHRQKLFHANLHGGNILVDNENDFIYTCISDVGLNIPGGRVEDGERPKISKDAPKSYNDLMEQCWNHDPTKRPTASKLYETIGSWFTKICNDPTPTEISVEFDQAEEIKFLKLEKYTFQKRRIHKEAIYTSRLLNFPALRQ